MGYTVRLINDESVFIVVRAESNGVNSVGVAKMKFNSVKWDVEDTHIHTEADSDDSIMNPDRICNCEYFGEDNESGMCYFTSYPALRSNSSKIFRQNGVESLVEYLKSAAECESRIHSK